MKHLILKILCAAAAAVAMISCTGKENPDPAGSSGLEMKSSAYYIAAGGSDVAYLSVYYDGVEVTGSPDITVYIEENGETSVYESTEWSSAEECEVSFYAEWNNETSEPIVIAAVSGIAEVPDDPQPDEWSHFVKNTLMVQGTSVGCAYCPYVMDALDKFYGNDAYSEYAEQAVLAALHCNVNVADPMSSRDILDVMAAFPTAFYGVPSLMFDLNDKSYIGSNATPALIASYINRSIENDAATAIAASVTGTESDGTVSVTAKVKVGEAGSYRIAAWLLEDGIEYFQYNGTEIEMPSTVTHNNAVRAVSCVSPAQGEYLGGKKDHDAETVVDFSCEFDISTAKVENLSNCHVVIFVTSPNMSGSSTFYLDNAVDCGINQRVGFRYE